VNFRAFLQKLEEVGEMKRVKEPVHWNIEAGALGAMAINWDRGPALLLENVVDYPGQALLGGLFTGPGTMRGRPDRRAFWSRLAVGLGLEKTIDYESFMEALLQRRNQPIPPLQVSTAPCKEVVQTGKDVDLLQLPIPLIHEGDGGRYGTAGIVIARDLLSLWNNWSINRWMVRDRDSLVLNILPDTDLATIYSRYQVAGEAMPCCIAIGAPAAAYLASATSLPTGVGEAEVAGGLGLEPIQLVKAKTNDLLVPADAEVVIEGEVSLERDIEGPCPEFVRVSEPSLKPVFKVKAITRRRDTIMPFVVEGIKISDSMALRSIAISMELMNDWRRTMPPNMRLRWLGLPPELRLGLVIAAVYPTHVGHNYRAIYFLLARKKKAWFDKVLLVDSDIPPMNLTEVYLDFAQKLRPWKGQGWWLEEMEYPLSPAAAWANDDELARGVGKVLVMDACFPESWSRDDIKVKVSFETCFPEEVKQKAIEKVRQILGTEPVVYPIPPEWARGPLLME